MSHVQDQAFTALGLRKSSSENGVISYHKDLDKANNKYPILFVLHGYPNSAYLWCYVTPLLSPHPLFVPDLPGYGHSTTPLEHDKVSITTLVLSALAELVRSLV